MVELLAAARLLFAERGFDAVSVRDISRSANVNHALLHRHFGTKENLLRELMRAEAARFAVAAGEVHNPVEALQRLFAANAADLTFARILAYSLLSKGDPAELLVEDGPLRQIADAVSRMAASESADSAVGVRRDGQARETTAIVTALALGWLLFEPFLVAATGLQREHLPQARAHVEQVVSDLVERSLGSS